MNLDLKEMINALKGIKNPAIICHTRPDGDTIGSGLALFNAFKIMNKNCDIFCDSEIPEKFNFLDDIKFFNLDEKENNYDAIIAVDCSDEARMGNLGKFFSSSKNTINIDHHISNTRYAKLNLVMDRSATAEIIYEIISNLIELDSNIANELFMGICTDTGSFAHKNVTKETFSVASKLMEAKADNNLVHYNMFKAQKKARVKLLGKALSSMRFFHDDRLALMIISKKDLEDFEATADMTEGFIDNALSVDTTEVAVCILQSKENAFKVSFRSKGKVDVNCLAGTFGGGGHILASGCMINGFLEDVVDKVVYTVSTYLD